MKGRVATDMWVELHFHPPLGKNGEGASPLAPRSSWSTVAARARAKLDEMNSNVRLRGVRHLCRGCAWWQAQVVVGHRGVFLFFLCPACPTYPALPPPALPRQPHHHCTPFGGWGGVMFRLVVRRVSCVKGWDLCLPVGVSNGQPWS